MRIQGASPGRIPIYSYSADHLSIRYVRGRINGAAGLRGVPRPPDLHLVPPILATWLAVFRPCFTAPVWNRVLVLVAGAVLAPGKRTVTQIAQRQLR